MHARLWHPLGFTTQGHASPLDSDAFWPMLGYDPALHDSESEKMGRRRKEKKKNEWIHEWVSVPASHSHWPKTGCVVYHL